MANNVVQQILARLEIDATGNYENHFYVINFDSSDEYAKIYSKLNRNAINTEFPTFGANKSDETVKITNYFELELDNIKYTLFLIADFENDTYYLKIGGI